MITLILEWSVAVTKSDLDQFPKFYEPSSNSRNGNKTLPISLLANFILSPKRIKLDHSHFSALIISLPHWRQKDISWQRVFCSILFYFPTKTNVFDFMRSLQHLISQIEIKWKSCMKLATKPIQLHRNMSVRKINFFLLNNSAVSNFLHHFALLWWENLHQITLTRI